MKGRGSGEGMRPSEVPGSDLLSSFNRVLIGYRVYIRFLKGFDRVCIVFCFASADFRSGP